MDGGQRGFNVKYIKKNDKRPDCVQSVLSKDNCSKQLKSQFKDLAVEEMKDLELVSLIREGWDGQKATTRSDKREL